MKKIISLFQRNYDTDRLVRDEVVPGAEWVVAGEGVATRKFDGTSCLAKSGVLYKRYDVKKGKIAPPGFEPAQDPDATTGHWPGWVPVGDGPEDKWHRAAVERYGMPTDGTYELLGPKVQGNPEGYEHHMLVRHGNLGIDANPRDFESVKTFLATANIEGIVWWRALGDDDCDKVKIKTKDFGLKR